MTGCEVGAVVLVAALDETGPLRLVVLKTIEGRKQQCSWILRQGSTVKAGVIREHAEAIEERRVRLVNQQGVILSDEYVFGASTSHRDQRARSRSR